MMPRTATAREISADDEPLGVRGPLHEVFLWRCKFGWLLDVVGSLDTALYSSLDSVPAFKRIDCASMLPFPALRHIRLGVRRGSQTSTLLLLLSSLPLYSNFNKLRTLAHPNSTLHNPRSQEINFEFCSI